MTRPPTALHIEQSRSTTRRPVLPAQFPAGTRQAGAPGPHQPHQPVAARRLSIAAAALILAGGYVHFCLYRHGYRFIPKIGVSFLLQAGSSAVLAAALLVRGGRFRLGRRSLAVAQLTRLTAIGLSLGTLAALGIAHTPGGLFQFHEIGLRPAPQTVIAILVESLAALLLTVALLAGRAATPDRTVIIAAASPTGRRTRDAA